MCRAIILLWFASAIALGGTSPSEKVCARLRDLGDAITMGSEARTPAQRTLIKQYKNRERATPQTIDLAGYPADYYARVLPLKKGDTVTFGDGNSFRLGKFLGAGNATHVWAIEGDPQHALRIPYYSFHESISMTKDLADRFISSAPSATTIHVAAPTNHFRNADGHVEYSLQERLDVAHNGVDFIFRLADKLRIEGVDERHFAKIYQPFYYLESPVLRGEERKKAELLFVAMKELDPDHSERIFNLDIAKQIVWDKRHGRWVLVDWE